MGRCKAQDKGGFQKPFGFQDPYNYAVFRAPTNMPKGRRRLSAHTSEAQLTEHVEQGGAVSVAKRAIRHVLLQHPALYSQAIPGAGRHVRHQENLTACLDDVHLSGSRTEGPLCGCP